MRKLHRKFRLSLPIVKKGSRSTRDFQNQTVVMVAAIFIDNIDIDRMSAWFFQQGGRRATQICDDGSALTQGLMVSRLRARTSCTKGSGRVSRFIGIGASAPILYATVVFGPPSKTFTTSITEASWSLRSGEPRSCPVRKWRKTSVPKLEVRVEADPHLTAVWFIDGNETGRVAIMIDREDVKAVRSAVAAVR
jgi:hypothetical protein